MLRLAFCILSASPSTILAFSADDTSPECFRLVTSLDELTEEGRYLIGAEYEVRADGRVNKGFCLLSNVLDGTSLMAVESTYPVESYLEESNPEKIWQIVREKDNAVYLYSPVIDKRVAEGKNATSLQLSTSGGLLWNVEATDRSAFIFHNSKDSHRALGLNWQPKSKRFGIYSVSGSNPLSLRLYKMQSGGGFVPGKVVKPADGETIALAADHQVAVLGAKGVELADLTPFSLQDHTLAHDSLLLIWTARHGEGETFILENDRGEGLESLVDGVEVAQKWVVDHGYMATATDLKKYLTVDAEKGFVLRADSEMVAQKMQPAYWVAVGKPAAYEMTAQGTKVLSGSWSSDRLSEIDFEDVSALDMTNILLPLEPKPFKRSGEGNNHLFYVAKESASYCPSSWKSVVLQNAEGECTFLDSLQLEDREQWVLDRKIKVGSGQVVYHREVHADGGWETLYLPFDATVPEDYLAEHYIGVSPDGGEVYFEKTRDIKAHEPVLIQYAGELSEPKVHFQVVSNKGEMTPEVPSPTPFKGVYLPMLVESGDVKYLLDAGGRSFVRAAATSGLAPFRAYLQGGEGYRVQVRHASPIAGCEALSVTSDCHDCYSVAGRRIGIQMTRTQLEQLPHGIYIVDGKKYIR